MKRYSLALAIGAAALGLAQAASAADLGRPQPYPPAKGPGYYAPPPFSWTGFYVGANAGYGWSNGDGTLSFGAASGPISGSGNGFLGGVQAGYNWQMNSFVFGVEGDFQGSSGKGDLNGTVGGTTVTGTLKTPWFATARGRLGYAWDRWMVYVTGGGVYGQAKWEGTLAPGGAFSSSETAWTWTFGGGVETAIWNNWSVKLEYLYLDKPNKFPVPPPTTALSGSSHTNIVRAGLNYHF